MQTLWAQSTQDKHSKSSNVWLPIFDQTLSSFIFLHKQLFGFVTGIYDDDRSSLLVYLMLYAKCCKLTDQVIPNMLKDCWHMVLLNFKYLRNIQNYVCFMYILYRLCLGNSIQQQRRKKTARLFRYELLNRLPSVKSEPIDLNFQGMCISYVLWNNIS